MRERSTSRETQTERPPQTGTRQNQTERSRSRQQVSSERIQTERVRVPSQEREAQTPQLLPEYEGATLNAPMPSAPSARLEGPDVSAPHWPEDIIVISGESENDEPFPEDETDDVYLPGLPEPVSRAQARDSGDVEVSTDRITCEALLASVNYQSGGSSGSKKIPFPDMRLTCLLYTSPSPRDLSTSRMPSSA